MWPSLLHGSTSLGFMPQRSPWTWMWVPCPLAPWSATCGLFTGALVSSGELVWSFLHVGDLASLGDFMTFGPNCPGTKPILTLLIAFSLKLACGLQERGSCELSSKDTAYSIPRSCDIGNMEKPWPCYVTQKGLCSTRLCSVPRRLPWFPPAVSDLAEVMGLQGYHARQTCGSLACPLPPDLHWSLTGPSVGAFV